MDVPSRAAGSHYGRCVVVPAAQLRIFVPRDTLDARDAARWTVRMGRTEARRREEEVALARLVGRRASVDDAAVLVRRVGDDEFVCPVQHDLRCALALRQLRADVPDVVVSALVGDPGLEDELDLIAAAGRTPTTIDAPWAVPLQWFALFSPAERRFTDPPEGAGPRLVHVTTARAAMDRLERVIDVLDVRVADADVVLDAIADLAEWVDSFDPRSWLELDYGGLADWLGAEALERDHSVADVWASVEALERGEVLEAAAHHATLRRRWRQPNAVVTSS